MLCLCLPENVVNIGETEICDWGHAISTKPKKRKERKTCGKCHKILKLRNTETYEQILKARFQINTNK